MSFHESSEGDVADLPDGMLPSSIEPTRQDSIGSTGSASSTGPLRLNPPPGLMRRMNEGSDGCLDGPGGQTGRMSSGSSTLSTLDRKQSGESYERSAGETTDESTGLASMRFMLSPDVDNWTVQNVEEWCTLHGLKKVAKNFVEHGIDGYLLMRLAEADLAQELNIESNLQRVKIMRAINNLKRMSTSTSSFSDRTGGQGQGFFQDGNTGESPSSGYVETDLSWLEHVNEQSRFKALVGWLLQKVTEVKEANHENMGPTLNTYTHAALGALATISGTMRPRSQWVSRGGSLLSRGSMRSHSHLSRGSNLNSNNSAGSRGSGAAAHFRLREVLESTPGWDIENMTFLSQPDLPWLHMRLKDLNEEINTTNNQAKTEAKSSNTESVHSEEMDKTVPTSAGGATQVVGQPTPSPTHDGEPSSPFSPTSAMSPSMNEGVPSARGGVTRSRFGGTRSYHRGERSGGSGGNGGSSGSDDGGDSVEECEHDADKAGFLNDMYHALEAATAARNLVADRYGMTKETAAAAIGHMGTMVLMDGNVMKPRGSVNEQFATVEAAVETAEKERYAAFELEEAQAAVTAAVGNDQRVSAVAAAAVATAAAKATQAEITQLQDEIMHQQKASMQAMHMAACERETNALKQFHLAMSDIEKSDAKALVQNAVMQQQELAVQEMQQSVMQQQQLLTSEVMEQQRLDAAEMDQFDKQQESMQLVMMSQQGAVKSAVEMHDEAMEDVIHQQEELEAALQAGDSDRVAKEKEVYKHVVNKQKDAMQNVKSMQQTLATTMSQHQTLQKELSVQKQMHNVAKVQRAKGVEKTQNEIQQKQIKVMQQAAAIQVAIPDTPEGRDMSVAEAARGYAGVEKKHTTSTSNTLTTSETDSTPSTAVASSDEPGSIPSGDGSGKGAMFSRGKISERASPNVEVSEEWEIDFSDIEFSPNGVPSNENRIGHGGFGEVFLGQLGGMHVAVKKLFDQEHAEQGMKEFRAEVSILSKLRHPSIVLWLGACSKAPNCTIVLEFMERGSLNQLLHRSNTPYTMITAMKWCISIARGMLYLHQHKPYPIIHCDLNSNNVLVNRDWAVKITDFGLSKVKRSSRLSRRSGITGTVNYAAPEVIRGAPPSEASDVYSFSMLVWEIYTRKVPWKDLTEYQIIYKMTATKHDPRFAATRDSFIIPEGLPEGTNELLHECWSAMPAMRPLFPRLVDEFRGMLRKESALAKQAKQNEGIGQG